MSKSAAFDMQFAQASVWPPCLLPSEFRGLCRHCEKTIYERHGILFHFDGYRACHWSAQAYAEVS